MVDVDGSKALYTRAKVRARGGRWGGMGAGGGMVASMWFSYAARIYSIPPTPPTYTLPVFLQSSDKTLRLVNTMWHILVKEHGNEKVCAGIADWIIARVP